MEESRELRRIDQKKLNKITYKSYSNTSKISLGYIHDEIFKKQDCRYLDFTGVDFKKREGNLYLINCDLTGSDFTGCDLSACRFEYSDLTDCNFTNCNLRNSYFGMSILNNTNFTNADCESSSFTAQIRDVNFCGANVTGVRFGIDVESLITDENTKGLNDQCPKEGEFIGWKKCIIRDESGWNLDREYIVELLIPADAKRSSATTKKCRCSKAEVLAIYDMSGQKMHKDVKVQSCWSYNCLYRVGETVKPNMFDTDYWKECRCGIHFFMNRVDAEEYYF